MEVKLTDTGKHKIEVIKLIKLFTDLGLKESKELVDKTPSIFHVNKPKIEFEQVKKNFAAIGAQIEKVEPIKKAEPVKDSVSNMPGEDLKEKTPIPKKTIRSDKLKNEKKKVLVEAKFTEQKTTKNYSDDKFFNLNKKADDLFFLKSVKSSLTIAIIGAAIYALSSLYYPLRPLFAYLVIGIIIAITIRSTTGKTSIDLGILAGAFTLFSFIIYPFFSNITYTLIYYESFYYMHGSNILLSFLSIFYPAAFIPAIVAYLIASNANLGKKLNTILKTGNKSLKSTFNSKSHKKGKRNIRRKKRDLD